MAVSTAINPSNNTGTVTDQNGVPAYQGVPTSTTATQGTSQSSGSSTSAPVDTLDAQLSREISQVAQQYGTQVFNWANSTLAPNQAVTNDVVGNYMQAAQSDAGLANQTAQQYTDIGAPALANLNNAAGSYSSKARQQVMAGQAEAGSMQGSQAGISSAEQQLQGFGINPNSGVYQELEQSNKAAAGASAAAAGTQASLATQAAGRGLQSTAVTADQQLPGQSINASTAAAGALGGASSAQLSNTATAAGALDASNPFLSTAQNITAEGTGSNSTNQSSSQNTSNSSTQVPSAIVTTNTSGLAAGGAIPDSATTGGFVSHKLSPSGGANTDDIPAKLNADEFVMPKDVAHWYGQKTFQDMILKARKAMGDHAQAPAKPSFAPPPQQAHAASGGAIPTGSW
jgi:hypothetical protein